MMISRRQVLLAGGIGLIGGPALATPGTAKTDYAADIAQRLDLGFRAGLLDGQHAVLVQQGNETLLERYFSGTDEDWSKPLGEVDFDAGTLHDVRSITKSIVSLLYAIALQDGLVPPPQAALLDSFPEYADLRADPTRAGWTISHALNMTLGVVWDEDLPYDDPANSEIAMELAADRYRFILERPFAKEPGTVWRYNGGCSALLGAIIERGTGESLSGFAEKRLFGPLGITTHAWNSGRDGVLSAASGLRLTAPALAKIGRMMLEGGMWQDRRLVPAAWLDRLSQPQVATGFGMQYSHQWYLSQQPLTAAGGLTPMLSGMGNGGQRLILLTDLDMVVVLFAGNYNRLDQWLNPMLILQRIILARLPAQ